mgnify:CR=1 FL=1
MDKKKGSLFIVSTPIGNLGDITLRGIETLKAVSFIVAEDTRHSKKLLNHYNINNQLISYFEHNSLKKIPVLINYLINGKDLALISDAGTPGISDPAYKVIRKAIENNISIIPIPGPSSFLAALSSSGLPTDRFIFEGFLPPKKGRRKRLFESENQSATLVFYESAKRLDRTLNDMLNVFGDRPAVVCREITKIHEEVIRGKISDLVKFFAEKKVKGELVILIGKNKKNVFFKK